MEAVKQAVHNEKEKKFEDAIENYTSAVGYFRSALISDENKAINSKDEVEEEINFYLNRMNKLEMLLLKKNEEQCVDQNNILLNESDGHQDESSNGKGEVEDETKFYLKRINKLEMLLQNKHLSSNNEDIKIRNRIKLTVLTQKPNVKLADVCGLETLKRDLIQAAILPLKQPQIFSANTRPFKGFLLFGVSMAIKNNISLQFKYVVFSLQEPETLSLRKLLH